MSPITRRLSEQSARHYIKRNHLRPAKRFRYITISNFLSKAFDERFEEKRGKIVNIASTFGAIGFPGYSVYSASKYAIRGFSQALARELADTGITVGSSPV